MTFLQHPMTTRYDPRPTWRMPNPAKLPSWEGARRVCVDTETCDPQLMDLGPGVRRDGYIVGVSFAIEDGPSEYLPVAHGSGPNMDPRVVWQYLRDQAKNFSGEIVGMNLPYDLDYLASLGIVFRRASWFRDVAVAAVLLSDIERGYSLDDILHRAGIPPKREDGLLGAMKSRCLKSSGANWKNDLWKLPAEHVADYAIGDVELPLTLLRKQERWLDKEDLLGIWDLESRVLPVTVKMRRRGVRIDLAGLDRVEAWAREQEIELLSKIRHRTGVAIPAADLLKKELTVRALQTIGVTLPSTPSGQPCTDAETLGAIDHPIACDLLRAKKFHMMRTMFVASFRRHLIGDRIHSTFRQVKGMRDGRVDMAGVGPGRFSSTDPNLTQQYNPKKEPEISGRWREIILPEEGALLASCDYAGQEPRLTIHYANMLKLPGAAAMVQQFIDNPNMDLHGQTAKLVGNPCKGCGPEREYNSPHGPGCKGCNGCGYDRDSAKIIFLAMCYGMGGAKLCQSLGLPTGWWTTPDGVEVEVAGDEGRALIRKFNDMVPFVKELAEQCTTRGEGVGSIRTLGGRLCRFPWSQRDQEYYDTHKALNRLIQGSSADQTKKALVEADDAGHFIQIPPHDELVGSVESPEEAQDIGRVMVAAYTLSLPTVVDVAVGKNWKEAG